MKQKLESLEIAEDLNKGGIDMQERIEQARQLLRDLEARKRECSFEQARRFFLIQEHLRHLKE